MTRPAWREERREKGKELAARLFAGAARQTPLPDPMASYTLEHLFGDVWQDDTLELSERSLITCAVLFALGREAELRLHLRGAHNLGVERAKIEAVATHVAHYAGWPAGASGLRIIDEVWAGTDASSPD